MPFLAEADANESGFVAIEADDGYTYYYDPADVEDAEDESTATADEYVYVESADADATGEEAPIPLESEWSYPEYSYFADASDAVGDDAEQQADHAAVLRAFSGIATPTRSLGASAAAAAGVAFAFTPGQGARPQKTENSSASHAQSEPPMNPRTRFGALREKFQKKSCIPIHCFLAALG